MRLRTLPALLAAAAIPVVSLSAQTTYPFNLPGAARATYSTFLTAIFTGDINVSCQGANSGLGTASQTTSCSYGHSVAMGPNFYDVGNLTVSGSSSIANGQLHAATSITGQLNQNFFLQADATAQYENRVTLSGGSGAASVQFLYALHGNASGLSGPGYTSNQPCGSSFIAGRLDFIAWSQVNPDGSPFGGHGLSSNCDTGDGSIMTGAFAVPFTDFTNGSLPFELTLAAFGPVVTNDPNVATANVDYVSDFSNTAGLTGFRVFDALGNDITADYVQFDAAAIPGVVATPEPATFVLLSTGLVGLGGFSRKRRSARKQQIG